MTDTIIQLLQQNNIPFNKKHIKDNIILVPGSLIKIKNIQFLSKGFNSGDINSFIKQIEKLIGDFNMSIYVLLEGIEMCNPVIFEKFYQYFYHTKT